MNKTKNINIRIGFDSCYSTKALEAFYFDENIAKCFISCEAARESSYINVNGEYYPCSFCEGEKSWEKGIDVLQCFTEKDFVEKVWNHSKTLEFLEKLNNTTDKHDCRHCPMFEV